MTIINLSPHFEPLGKGLNHESFFFSGGEPHIRLRELTTTKEVTITIRVRQFCDIGTLLVATNALRLAGFEEINLLMPYFPGARQDRIMQQGEPLTAKVYAEIINTQNFKRVTIFDPHSEVTPALIDRVQVVQNHRFIEHCVKEISPCVLIAPDAGALKKIYKLSEYLGGQSFIECRKTRDALTGKLSDFKVLESDLGGRTCLLVDDICDGGLTFIGLAKTLKEHNAGKLYLAVSHGIFSKGLQQLTTCFERIFTTDSFYDQTNPNVRVIPLGTII